MLNRTLRVTVMSLLITSAALSAGACAGFTDPPAAQARQNNARIATLERGMTPEQVLAHIGPSGRSNNPNPFKTEMYPAGDDTFRILYFYSQRTKADGNITDDELMPVVFKNGLLDGWGWSYWEGLAAQYSIRIRP
jgi:hypothetical protein